MTDSKDPVNMAMQVSLEDQVRDSQSAVPLFPKREVMEHVSERQFADLAAGQPLPAQALTHVNECPACQARRDHHLAIARGLPMALEPEATYDIEEGWAKLNQRIARNPKPRSNSED